MKVRAGSCEPPRRQLVGIYTRVCQLVVISLGRITSSEGGEQSGVAASELRRYSLTSCSCSGCLHSERWVRHCCSISSTFAFVLVSPSQLQSTPRQQVISINQLCHLPWELSLDSPAEHGAKAQKSKLKDFEPWLAAHVLIRLICTSSAPLLADSTVISV